MIHLNQLKPTSRTTRQIEEWTVRVDYRWLQAPNEELDQLVPKFPEAKLPDIS